LISWQYWRRSWQRWHTVPQCTRPHPTRPTPTKPLRTRPPYTLRFHTMQRRRPSRTTRTTTRTHRIHTLTTCTISWRATRRASTRPGTVTWCTGRTAWWTPMAPDGRSTTPRTRTTGSTRSSPSNRWPKATGPHPPAPLTRSSRTRPPRPSTRQPSTLMRLSIRPSKRTTRTRPTTDRVHVTTTTPQRPTVPDLHAALRILYILLQVYSTYCPGPIVHHHHGGVCDPPPMKAINHNIWTETFIYLFLSYLWHKRINYNNHIIIYFTFIIRS